MILSVEVLVEISTENPFLLEPFLVVIKTTPVAPWIPYNEVAAGPFNTEILSISFGLISIALFA